MKKSRSKKKTVVICSSASFYKQVIEAESILKRAGFRVVIPLTAHKMRRSGDFRVETYKTWFNNPENYKRKGFLTKHHFNKIVKGDSVLVLNYKKKDIDGYIGGAVLAEMAIAFHFHKPIYVLNSVANTIPYEEEIHAMAPIWLGGELDRIPT